MLYAMTQAFRLGLIGAIANPTPGAMRLCEGLKNRKICETAKKAFHSSSTLAEHHSLRSREIHPKRELMTTSVKRMLPILQTKGGEFLTQTMQHIYDETTQTHCYGIHRNEQQVEDDIKATRKRYSEIKSRLLAKMELSPDTPFIEIVGDSAAYSPTGTTRTLHFLDQYLPIDAVWIYGYTGHTKDNGTKCVNAAVSYLAEKRNHLDKTIGNLVGFHSPAALDEWGCTGPDLNHYILVYGDDETNRKTGTVFGDDITTSDFLSDRLLLAGGGIQSFRQACNFFLLERPVLAIDELRGDNTRFAVLPDGTRKDYFSAPEFLQFIKMRIASCKEVISEDLLNAWYNSYLRTHLLADPKRNDYDTKQKLLDEAWKLFKEHRLYEKLTLFTLLEPDLQRSRL